MDWRPVEKKQCSTEHFNMCPKQRIFIKQQHQSEAPVTTVPSTDMPIAETIAEDLFKQ
jgi:hypothetical protein